jgi:hypothetical protein
MKFRLIKNNNLNKENFFNKKELQEILLLKSLQDVCFLNFP